MLFGKVPHVYFCHMPQQAEAPKPTIILDRDGVINQDSANYITVPEEWIPIAGSLEAIGRMHGAGYRIVVATNQSAVGRGFCTAETLEQIHARMKAAVRREGGELAGIYVCPHSGEAGCDCRKPAPGLFHQIEAALSVDLASCIAVGDSERDILAARKAGARPVLVLTGHGQRTMAQSKKLENVPVYRDLAAFADALLSTGIGPAEAL